MNYKPLSDREDSLALEMNTRNSTLIRQDAAEPVSNASSVSAGLDEVLERFAYNAALEARLRREGIPRVDEAVAAVRRVSAEIARQAGFDVSEDERGDIWALREGVAIAFLGHRDGSDPAYPLT
jgi:hypothetical protein